MTGLNGTDRKPTEPFLKWAGGKRWFVQRHSDLLPKNFDRYVEPFLGSGAVFFHLQPGMALITDINEELIETYLAVRDDWRKVYEHLRVHQAKHCKQHYYRVRQTNMKSPYARAARFIYLNRTCWNGLYRVNLDGVFNVPIGTKQNVIMQNDDFESIAALLRNADVRTSDFKAVVDSTKAGDFLFVDPPYTVKHENNGFVKYNEKLFRWEDQIRLRNCLADAADRGVKVLLTNASHYSIHEIYSERFDVIPVSRQSVIAADRECRRMSEELIIRSYE